MDSRRVVLIDDDGVCLAILAKGLRKRGFEVSAYGDPREAMKRLEQDRPQAVITDVRMPHMTGLEVVQEVKARLGSAAPPVLVVSVDDEEQLLEQAFQLGAVDYLLKPVNEVELGVKLERALRPQSASGRHRALPSMPERVGEWTLVDCVGRGGTACVFTAVREGEPQLRALKVVWPHRVDSTETMLRFRREIDTLSALSHPRLVQFVASGRSEDYFYYVMSFLPGGTLRRRIKLRGAASPLEALRLVEELADPLGYLHERGIVHRDLKPGNVFFDERDQPVLGDFGLARRVHDRGITLQEEFIGTPLYLAPEVFRSPEFDQSVDFYSLGVCALEMLLGQPPLEGESDTVSLIGTIMDEGLPRPTALLPGTPRPVVDLLERLLAPRDAGRPASAAEVVAAVKEARRRLG